jgi:hypothetical protein
MVRTPASMLTGRTFGEASHSRTPCSFSGERMRSSIVDHACSRFWVERATSCPFERSSILFRAADDTGVFIAWGVRQGRRV